MYSVPINLTDSRQEDLRGPYRNLPKVTLRLDRFQLGNLLRFLDKFETAHPEFQSFLQRHPDLLLAEILSQSLRPEMINDSDLLNAMRQACNSLNDPRCV